MSHNLDLILVGAGNIAEEHLKVALSFGLSVEVIGRGKTNIERLRRAYPSVNFSFGGINRWVSSNKCPRRAIVATSIDSLFEICSVLLKSGVDTILVEKPLSFSIDQVSKLIQLENKQKSKIFIGYNRRFYDSIIKAKKYIKDDGGPRSMHFDFTEALFRISPDNYSSKVLNYWGIANSSHVIDTAFYLAGFPDKCHTIIKGSSIDWHPSGDRFFGSGITCNDATFSYSADWSSPGRWSLSVSTNRHKLILCPMEKLQIQKYGSFETFNESVDEIDVKFKPGFYRQFEAWMGYNSDNIDSLMGLKEYYSFLIVVKQIFNYQ